MYYNPTSEFIRQLGLAAAKDDRARELLEQIESGHKRPIPFQIISRMAMGNGGIKFFDSSDTRRLGLGSLAQAKLQKGMIAMPYRMSVNGVYDSTAKLDDDKLFGADFKGLHTLNAGKSFGLENGAINVRVGGSDILPDQYLSILNKQEGIATPIGAFELPATELIFDDEEFQVEYKVGKGYTIPDYIGMEFRLDCVATFAKGK